MEIHGNLQLKQTAGPAVSVSGISDSFPATPTVGQYVLTNKVLYICVAIEAGMPLWIPLTNALNMLKFAQATPALEWTIPHSFNTSSVLVQVYDDSGKWILPDVINTAFNGVSVAFSTPTSGTAILMRGELEGGAFPTIAFEATFGSSTSWVVNHSLGYNPQIFVYVDSTMVQPQSIVHNSVNQTTITFTAATAGTVRCV